MENVRAEFDRLNVYLSDLHTMLHGVELACTHLPDGDVSGSVTLLLGLLRKETRAALMILEALDDAIVAEEGKAV
jgi:hypothetical protein